MLPKAPRIAEEIWEQHRDEIIDLYCAPKGTLKKTMDIMKEKYGFQATKSQYTTKFEAWGIQKYADNTTWIYAYQKTRKRKLEENKDTGLITHGRRRTQREVEKEIARNVTSRTQLQLLEDIPTPEGVEVFTPGAEVFPTLEVSSPSVTLRKVCLSNLPSVRLQQEIQKLIYEHPRIYKSNASRPFSTSDPSSSHRSSPSIARLLQVALGDEVNVAKSLYSFLKRTLSLTSYFPSVDTSSNISLQGLLQYFIILTNDGVLSDWQKQKGIQWLSMNLNDFFLSNLFSYETLAIKTFIRKIFPAVVADGNIKVAKSILEGHIDILRLLKYRSKDGSHTQQEECMSIAVINGDIPMVELLCTVGFSPRKLGRHALFPLRKLPWDTGNLEVLQALLSFGAHPECFIVGESWGYPLVDAATSGSLDAVNILIMYGSRVNCHVKGHFGTALQAAVWAGHLEMAEFLITRGADFNAPFGSQYQLPNPSIHTSGYGRQALWSIMTPIQIACAKNNTPLAESLLTHGADPNLSPLSVVGLRHWEGHDIFPEPEDERGLIDYSPNYDETYYLTALQHSVRNGNIDLIQLLLLRGANPNSRATRHQWEDTPLQLSIRLDHSDITRTLIDSGANVNASPGEFNGRTALQAAAESGNIQIAKVLLSKGADINAPPAYERGLTALQAAIIMRRPLMAGFLCISGADINAPPAPDGGLTAIQAAAEVGDLNLINDLMRHGGVINNETAGSKAILASISHMNLPMLKLLLKKGALVDRQGNDGNMPPIVPSAMKKWVDGVHYLLDNGADINSYYFNDVEYDNISPLAWSIINHHTEMIDLLLKRGASLNFPFAQEPYDDSLCLALRMRCPKEIIDMLIKEYARMNSPPISQKVLTTAVRKDYDSVSGYYDPQIIATVLKAMSKIPRTSYASQVKGAWNEISNRLALNDDENTVVGIITLLLEAGADINAKHPSDRTTLLQKAIWTENIEIAEFLVNKGAEIQVPASSYIGTPLQEAIKTNRTKFVHFLMEKSADINASPAEYCGTTSLQAAAKNGNKSLVTILLEHGAEVNAPPARNRGITALQAAAIKGHIDIAIDLLQHGAHVSAPGAQGYGRTAIDGAAKRGHEDMLQLLLNHYDGCENLSVVCERAANYAKKEGHGEIASWLRQYPNLSTKVE